MENLNQEIAIVTCALPYSNGEPHLGHLASTYLPADILVRFLRMIGKKVFFISGSDDYGTPILISAEKEGKKPEEYIKKWWKVWQEDLEKVSIKFDFYGHTYSDYHNQLAQYFFKKIKENGFIYEKEIEQFYCPKCKRFLPDRYVIGTCPYCGARNQYGDVCEICGRTYSPLELKDPRCAICGSKPIIKKSKHYFFKLSSFSEKLREWLISNKNLQNEVKNYVLAWIKEGLKDWDISRDIEWGVPIPNENKKVLYGWFENHIGYISFFLELAKQLNLNGKEIWNKATIYHFIGKDIVYHHYLFLPAERMAEGSFKLPDFIPTRGYLLLEDQKFSKSRNWYISIKDFVSKFDSDYLRYYLASIVSYSQQDSNFKWKDFESKINNELISIIANFIHRVLTFAWNNFEGKIPKPKEFDSLDKNFEKEIQQFRQKYLKTMNSLHFDKALKQIVEFASKCNQYFQTKKPWETKDPNSIYLGFKASLEISLALYPFIPNKIEKLWEIFNLDIPKENAYSLNFKIENHSIKKPKIIFEKIDPKLVENEINKLRKIKKENMKEISIDEFRKIEMKVGKVLEVEEIPGSKNLYKLIVDFGNEKRQVISGLKKYYKPEDLKNKKFVFVTNLERKKFMGYESQAMILAAEDSKGNVILIVPEKDVEVGSKIL
ncbi:MAG: methionine--tRNA ligase [Candidatus Aenigmarchaeota archaeon ex4484_224]|nr:MAG: methionine--tRNA ligase [Candidatus Aenigmarchaeota archaeon ex4484_224]